MPNLTDLRARQQTLVQEARERLDNIGAATDDARRAELETQHDAAMREYDRLEGEARRELELQEREQRHQSRQEGRRPNGDNRTSENDNGGGEQRGGSDDDAQALTYRMAFAKTVCGQELNDEERSALRSGRAEFRTQTAGTTTAGGFVVPTTLANFISIAQKASGPMYDGDIVTEIVTSGGGSIKVPTIDDTAVDAVAHTEGTALTDDGGSDVTFGQKSLDAYAFDTEFVKWSWELEADSIFNMERLLGTLLGKRLGKIANAKLTTGTGSSQPNGIVTASSLGKTAAGATAITADEIIDLLHSVDPDYRTSDKARFMFNDAVLAVIRKLKDGDGNYLWQMGDVTKGVPGTLLGYRYSVNQAMDTIAAAKKVILFGDFGEYYVRKVGQPVIGVLKERFWPDMGIAGLIRFDGEIGQSGAVKHLITAAS